MKKVIIIGGGVAGLSAGIYAQKRGFETEIYEKNLMVGGECTGWDRQGYHVDNCIHWLTGCRDNDAMRDVWYDLGALDDSTELFREPYFYKLEMDGVTLHFWSDLEKARKEFLDTAPEDAAEINKFFDSVKRAECVRVPCEKSVADMSFMEYMKLGMSMMEMGMVIKEYGKTSIDGLAARFSNKYVSRMMNGYLCGSYMANTLISSYAFYTGGSAAIPMGGSVEMIKRMAAKYESLGGKIHTGMSAESIEISRKAAKSVTFDDGKSKTAVGCDYVICACDPDVVFPKLLDAKYMDKTLRKMYAQKTGYRVTSGFGVAFGIRGTDGCGTLEGSVSFPCEAFKVGETEVGLIAARMYDYDPKLFPEDKRVVQCNILQYENDYEYWKALYNDKEKYNAEKNRIAQEVRTRIEEHFPELSGRLEILSTFSPMTFTKWCGAYKGGYMSFFEQPGFKSLTAKNEVKGLNNVLLASQWLTTSGGLPTAAVQGKFAAQKLV